MAEDKGKEEEKFDFTAEGEGYISLDEARVLAMRTALESPGNYGRDFRRVAMAFEVVESTETEDHYTVTLSFRPQRSFDGTPGQEQFVIGKDGTIAVRQVLSSIVRTGGGFPVIPVAIGVVVVGIIAAVGAIFLISSSGGDSVPVAAVVPTETPAPTQPPAPTETLAPTETPRPTPTFTPMPTYTPYPTPTPRPTYTPRPIPTARVIVVTPIPTPTKTPSPTPSGSASSYVTKGKEYFNAVNYPMAIEQFTLALQVDPQFGAGTAYYFRGLSYRRLGQYQQAVQDYDKAIEMEPNNGARWKVRAIVYSFLGQSTLADADNAKACSLDSQWCPSIGGGAATLDIGVNGDALQFDLFEMSAAEGVEVVVNFNNSSGVNFHIWALVENGTKDAVATDGAAAGQDNNWLLANDSRVFGSTILVGPGESADATFTAPAAGIYQFVCTFPGHNFTMFGDFIVN